MCNALLSCPLCSLPRFHDLETLRVALIKVATENLSCPICGEVYMGLDKLTIHLFSHRENDVRNKQCETNLKTEDESLLSDRDTNSSSISEANDNDNTLSSAEVREYTKRKSKSKKVISTKNVIIGDDNSDNATSPQSLPVFNMNTIPFIGIPHNISIELPKAKSTKHPEKRKNKSDRLSEKCDICGFFFLGKNILEMHKKLIHNIHNSEIVNGVSHYCCHICSKVFKMKGSLMVHLRMVHFAIIPSVNEDTVEKNEDSKSDLEMPKDDSNAQKMDGIAEPSPGKTWKCDICEKTFTTKYFLKKHKRLHTGEMPYSCTQCNKTFTFQQSYHKHLLYHNDEKPHACSHCGRGFKELSTLHNHQRIHTGEKPFECETCGKCFRQRVSYLVHRRIHTGAMPYKCTACDKSFRYKVSQRMHKCTAQPPGTVIRQSGELVQKLLKNQMDVENAKINEDIENKISKECLKIRPGNNDKILLKDGDLQINTDDILGNICNPSFGDDCNITFTDKSSSGDEKNCIIDEIVKESISKIDFSDPKPSTSADFHTDVGDLYSIVSRQNDNTNNNNMEESLPSPSERMKNLKLNSLSPDGTIETDNISIKGYDKHDISYIFEMPETQSLNCYSMKDKDVDFMQNNMECHDIFTNR